MAWIPVPSEHHPIFRAALPKDPRVETQVMFGGVAAKLNGHFFAGLFQRSVMIWLPEERRGEALALEGAGPFDPFGDGKRKSDKVMLPEAFMEDPAELKRWVKRAFDAVNDLPAKTAAKPRSSAKRKSSAKPKPSSKPKPKRKQPARRAASS